MIRIIENHSLIDHNTFRIRAIARQFVEFTTAKDLFQYLKTYDYKSFNRFLFLGGGSNILFLDHYDGLVLHPNIKGIEKTGEDNDFVYLETGAGVLWDHFVDYCVGKGWGGIENLSLIPGNTGTSPVQNIGAYGQEVATSVVSVTGYDFGTGFYKEIPAAECRFGYRDSIFKKELKGRFLILSVRFKLSKNPLFNLTYGNLNEIVAKTGSASLSSIRQAVIAIRSSKLPDPAILGNAGSFFKNPVVSNGFYQSLKNEYTEIPGYPDGIGFTKLAAGWLIEKCGWKGYREGNAGVHVKQALVLINYGDATGKQIFSLSEKIRESVFQKFGVMLEREINCI